MTHDGTPEATSPASSRRDRFGLVAAAVGALLYVAATIFFVLPLSQQLDTFLIVSFLFVPAVVGGFVYDRIERRGGWD